VLVAGATSQCVLDVMPDGSALRMWKIASHLGSKSVPLDPTGLAVAPDGSVWVTAGVQAGELQKYDASGAFLGTVAVGHSPCSPVVADGSVWVLNRFAHTVKRVDASAMKVVAEYSVLREPSAAVWADGKLFVANLLPYCAATNDLVAAAVSVIDPVAGTVKHTLLANGSTGVRGITAYGKRVYAVHTMGRYQLPTTQLERGWMNTAAMSVLDTDGTLLATVLLDDSERGACNPWGVAVSPDGKWLAVNHAGTGEMSLIDRAAFDAKIDPAKDSSIDLTFLVGMRRRVELGGEGPRGLVFADGRAVAALYYADKIVSVDPETYACTPCAVGPEKDLTKDKTRRGEMLYNSGTMCFQRWQSCASCHPDGRADALSWDLLNDGVGNPKQTKSQLWSQFTPPTMVTGIRKDYHTCNRAGLIHIQFVQRPDFDGQCIDAYNEAIAPVPSPYLVNGKLSARAERGCKLFEKAKCADCHGEKNVGPNGEKLWTDCKTYDVGVGTGMEKGRAFDTPTLAEVWRTAPYLYDGRALTMREVLREANPEDKHGETSALTDDEIDDLAEYVLSL